MTTITTTIAPNLLHHPALSRMKFDARRPPDPIRVIIDVGMNTLSIVATGPTGQIMRHNLDIPYCFQGASGGSDSSGHEAMHISATHALEHPPRREALLDVQGPSKAVFTQLTGFGRVDVEVHAFDSIKVGAVPYTPASTAHGPLLPVESPCALPKAA